MSNRRSRHNPNGLENRTTQLDRSCDWKSNESGAGASGKALSAQEAGGSFRQRHPRLKWLVSGLILFHLLAVVLPPLAFQTSSLDGPSPLIGLLIRPFAGYGQFFHLDRGYAFFAPDPGPSHLIQAAIIRDDDSVVEQMYPNRNEQWPRLLYHRHFMLTEYLNEVYFPPGPPDEMFESDRASALIWQQRRARYEHVRQSLIDHLKSENDGREVALRRIEHAIPSLQDYVAEPIALDDPRLYNVLLDQPIFSDDISPPAPTEVIPAPTTGPPRNLPPEQDQAAIPTRHDAAETSDRPTGPTEAEQ